MEGLALLGIWCRRGASLERSDIWAARVWTNKDLYTSALSFSVAELVVHPNLLNTWLFSGGKVQHINFQP